MTLHNIEDVIETVDVIKKRIFHNHREVVLGSEFGFA
jgi:hypothetical protein